jgi:predicted site-specific integrase-resolvase
MPVTLSGQKYYRTAEVCGIVGISRTTLFRWLTEGTFSEPEYRDRRGWRLFTEEEVNKMETEANRISKTDTETFSIKQ